MQSLPVLTHRGCPPIRFQPPHLPARTRSCHLPPQSCISATDGKTKAPSRSAIYRVTRNNSEPHTQPSAPRSKLTALTSRRSAQPGWTPTLQPRSAARNTAAAILTPRTLAFCARNRPSPATACARPWGRKDAYAKRKGAGLRGRWRYD